MTHFYCFCGDFFDIYKTIAVMKNTLRYGAVREQYLTSLQIENFLCSFYTLPTESDLTYTLYKKPMGLNALT